MKIKPEEIQAVNFGVHIKLNDQQKGTQITGVYPSHSIPDFEALVNRVVDFLNEVLGVRYQAVRVYVEEDFLHTCGDCGATLEIVRPGKYQCPNDKCKSNLGEEENGKQATVLAEEADRTRALHLLPEESGSEGLLPTALRNQD